MPLWGMAQTVDEVIRETFAFSSMRNTFFKHLDVGVTVGTDGFGIDLTTQLTPWAQLRAGYTISPVFNLKADLDVWKPIGQKQDNSMQNLLASVIGMAPDDKIYLESEFDMQSVKLLFDIFPVKKNRKFHVTFGAYYGPNHLGSFVNESRSFNTLAYIRAYNMVYGDAMHGHFINLSPLGVTLPAEFTEALNKTLLPDIVKAEDITIPVGTYSHDIVAEDGTVRYHQGDLVMLRPNNKDVIKVDVHVNKLKPYIGAGYTFALSQDGKSSIDVDAGIMFWGRPKVTTTVVQNYTREDKITYLDLNEDVEHVPGKLGNYARKFHSLPVFPEISLRFSRRLW